MKMNVNKSLFVLLSSIGMLIAGTANAADPVSGAQSPLGGLLPLVVIFVIFYFFLIRPQQKKAKEQQNMINALKKDDKVITSGGIHGVVTAVKGDVVELRIAENVKILVSKVAIATVVTTEAAPAVTPEIVK